MQRGSAGQMQRDNHQGNGTGGYMNRQAGSSVMGLGSRELDPVTPTPRSANLNRLGLPMIPADLGRIKPRPKQQQQHQQQHAQPAVPRRQTTFPSSLVQQRHLPRITEDEDAAEDERQSEHEHEHEQVSFFKFKPDDFDYQPLGPSHSTPRIKRAASAPVQQVMAANPIVRSKLEGNILMAWNESGERVPPKVDWKTALAIIYNSRIENNIYVLVQGVKQCRNCRDHARTHWDFGKSKTKKPFVQCFRPENNVTDGKSPAQRCTQCLLQNKVCVFDDDDDDDDEKGMEEETDEESTAIEVERARARALLARIDELETKSNRIEELEDTVASLRKQLGEMDTRMKRMAIVIVQLQDQRRA